MDIYQITPTRIALRSRLHSLADLPPGAVAEGVWNQIAYEGQWQGHAAGEFKFDEEIFETIIANFARREDDIPATYGHPDGESGAAEGAAGWISELKIDTDEKGRTALFAKFKFNDRAAQKIKADELRYCSVVVGFESIDEVTGEPIGAELFEVGLVLSAFLDGMQRLAASREFAAASSGGGMAMDAAQVRAKLAELAQVLNLDLAELEDEDVYMKVWDSVSALLQASTLAEILGDGGGEAAPAAAASRGVSTLVDAVKCKLDLDALKTALDQLTDDASPDQVKQVIDGALMQQEALGGADPAPAAPEAEADKPKLDDAPVDPIKAEDDPMPEEPPAEDPHGAEVALPAALAEVFAAALGVAPEELAALNPDEVAAAIGALQSMPEQEDAAAAGAAMARAMAEAVEVKLEKERVKTADLTATVSKQSDELAKLRVDLMIAKGEIVEGKHTREELIEFSKSSPAMFAKFAAGGEKVPTGSVYRSGKTERRHAVTPNSVREALAECRRSVKAENPKLKRSEVHSRAYEIAKSKYPELFDGKRAEERD